jgi:hypothetical protein
MVKALSPETEATMLEKITDNSVVRTSSGNRPNEALAVFQSGRLSSGIKIQTTPAGLLAVGALVTGILLSIPPIIKTAKRNRL